MVVLGSDHEVDRRIDSLMTGRDDRYRPADATGPSAKAPTARASEASLHPTIQLFGRALGKLHRRVGFWLEMPHGARGDRQLILPRGVSGCLRGEIVI